MEQVFDFREFIITLFKKCKFIIILALVFALLGTAIGFVKGSKEQYMTTSGAGINLVKKSMSATPLTDMMKNIDSVISDDFFYTGLLNKIESEMTSEHFYELIGSSKHPKLKDLQKIIKVYTKGNLILIDTIAQNKELTAEAGKISIAYTIKQIEKLNKNIVVTSQEEQTVNVKEQQGNSLKKSMLKFGILGFAGGIIIAILCVFFVRVFDLRIKCADDLKKYRLPILGELTQK